MSSKCWPAPLCSCPHQRVPVAGRESSRRWASLWDSESQPPLWPLSLVLSELFSKCEDQEGRVQVPSPPPTCLVTPHPQPPPPPPPQGFSAPQLRPLQLKVPYGATLALAQRFHGAWGHRDLLPRVVCLLVSGQLWLLRGPGGRLETIRGGGRSGMSPVLCSGTPAPGSALHPTPPRINQAPSHPWTLS